MTEGPLEVINNLRGNVEHNFRTRDVSAVEPCIVRSLDRIDGEAEIVEGSLLFVTVLISSIFNCSSAAGLDVC
jgi:hypothetical protein